MRSGRIGWLVLAGLLAGCTTDDLALTSVVVVAAPVVLIAQATNSVRDSVRDSAKRRNRDAEFYRLQALVAQGDRQALRQAILWAGGGWVGPGWKSKVPDAEFYAMYNSAVTQLIGLDKPDLPHEDVLPMAVAYGWTMQQTVRQRSEPFSLLDPIQAERAWQLVGQLPKGGPDVGAYSVRSLKDELARYVFLSKLQNMTEKQADQAFADCYSGALLPQGTGTLLRKSNCRDAYVEYMTLKTHGAASSAQLAVPQALADLWGQQEKRDEDKRLSE